MEETKEKQVAIAKKPNLFDRLSLLDSVEKEYHTFYCNLTQNSTTEEVFKNSNKIEFYTKLKEFFEEVILPEEYYVYLNKVNLLKTLYSHTFKDRYLLTDSDCLKLVQDYIIQRIKTGVIYN